MPKQSQPVRTNWRKVNPEIAKTILEQGELYLKGQLDIALASDRRAVTVGSVFSTLATTIAGATLAIFNETQSMALLTTGLATTLWLAVAAGYGFSAAWPTKFHIAGNWPELWWPHTNLPLSVLLGKESENYQYRIGLNIKCIELCSERLRRGARFAVTAPVIAFVFGAFSLYLFPS